MLAALIISSTLCAGALLATLAQAAEIRRLRELIEPWDHNHDGKPGG